MTKRSTVGALGTTPMGQCMLQRQDLNAELWVSLQVFKAAGLGVEPILGSSC